MNSTKMSCVLVLGIIMTCVASDQFIRVPLHRNTKLSNSVLSNVVPLNYTTNGVMHQFYGKVSVGTPPQNFSVLYDTGSADMWLVSAKCTIPQCKKYHRYDHSKSSTYIKNGTLFNYTYGVGAGEVTGFWSKDDIMVGGIKVKKQQFGEATQWNATAMTLDGIIGLSFNIDGVNTVMENMVQQHCIKNPVVSFYMSSHFQEPDQVGEMVLGGSNPEHYIGDLTYIPTVHNHYFPNTWNINCDGLYVNGKNFLPITFPTMIDTGNNCFGGPSEVMEPLIKELGADKSNIPCSEVNKQPDIVFQFNGIKFPLKAINYYKMVKDGTCQLNFFIDPKQYDFKMFSVGHMFIQQYYTEFDFGKKRIGFAPSK